MQINHCAFSPQVLSKYLTSVDTACTSRSKGRDSVIILHLGVLGDKDRGELIMHSTSKSPAPPSFRLTTKHFLIFTRYFPVDKVFSLPVEQCVCREAQQHHLQVSFASLFPVQTGGHLSWMKVLCKQFVKTCRVEHTLAFRKRTSLFTHRNHSS